MEIIDRVINCEKGMEGLRHDVENLIGWQKTQNGSIIAIQKKVDTLDDKFDQKLDSVKDRLTYGGIAVIAIEIISKIVG